MVRDYGGKLDQDRILHSLDRNVMELIQIATGTLNGAVGLNDATCVNFNCVNELRLTFAYNFY